jgi:hypothetical protein
MQLNLTSVRNHDTGKLLHGRSLGFLDCMNDGADGGMGIFKLFSKSFHRWIYLWREIFAHKLSFIFSQFTQRDALKSM